MKNWDTIEADENMILNTHYTPGRAGHKANADTIPGLTTERTKAIVLLVVQMFALAQTGLSLAGISQLPFTSDQVSTAITGVIAVIASLYSWWHNNNITSAAVQGQQLTTAIKTGSIDATQGTSPATTSTLTDADLETFAKALETTPNPSVPTE